MNLSIKTSDFLTSVQDPRRLPPAKPEIAFVGRSNVGKSSLINLLLGRKALAKVSGKPGKTRLVNYFTVNEDIYFVDLPGYGFARTSQEMRRDWSKMIEEYLLTPRTRLVVQLLDARHGVTRMDLQSIEWLCYNMVPVVIVLTKCDKLSKAALGHTLLSLRRQLKPYSVLQILASSTKSRHGRDELLGYLGAWLKQYGRAGKASKEEQQGD